ncbi:MAG: hypothetical protein WC421_09910 [Elusimicrobiales bacterium]
MSEPEQENPQSGGKITPAVFFSALGVMWLAAYLAHFITRLPERQTDAVFMAAALVLAACTLAYER